MKIITCYTIYNPASPIEHLRLFKTKKAATDEYNRIYDGNIRTLLKDYAPSVGIRKVTIEI